MDFLQPFCQYKVLKSVVVGASNQSSVLSRFFGPKITKLIYSTKVSNRDQFLDSLPRGYLDGLASGDFSKIDLLVEQLDFTSAGRLTASLSLLVLVVEEWSARSCVSFDILTELLLVPAWRKIIATAWERRAQPSADV
ncbi:small E1B [Tree shrew adenovirus 1]|uniref:E1B protein, small T-antigen n=1 Tax=Tree shrew adenovirus serotype 1 TaxID=47680 RepID=A0A2U9AG74_ADET1|nr:small E1B [Tree shrew adenovirus 1]